MALLLITPQVKEQEVLGAECVKVVVSLSQRRDAGLTDRQTAVNQEKQTTTIKNNRNENEYLL